MSQQRWKIFIVFLVCDLRGDGSFCCILFCGEQSAGVEELEVVADGSI